MRLTYLCVVAALVTALNAFKLPNGGWPDGTTITFYMWHKGNEGQPEEVRINFYDDAQVDLNIWEHYDVTAHFRANRVGDFPLVSNTKENGKWLTEQTGGHGLDALPPSTGWWRVDLIKHDEFRISAFFQGRWMGLRTFEKSLNNLRSVNIISPFAATENSGMTTALLFPIGKNILNLHVNATQFEDYVMNRQAPDVTFCRNEHFKVGAQIDLTVVLRAAGKPKDYPTITLAPLDGSDYILKLAQTYWNLRNIPPQLSLWSNETNYELQRSCTDAWTGGASGDLHHLRLERVSPNVIKLQLLYTSAGVNGTACGHTIPKELANKFDKPFDIIGHNGAVILKMVHRAPAAKNNRN